jgi:hypothetical protein
MERQGVWGRRNTNWVGQSGQRVPLSVIYPVTAKSVHYRLPGKANPPADRPFSRPAVPPRLYEQSAFTMLIAAHPKIAGCHFKSHERSRDDHVSAFGTGATGRTEKVSSSPSSPRPPRLRQQAAGPCPAPSGAAENNRSAQSGQGVPLFVSYPVEALVVGRKCRIHHKSPPEGWAECLGATGHEPPADTLPLHKVICRSKPKLAAKIRISEKFSLLPSHHSPTRKTDRFL